MTTLAELLDTMRNFEKTVRKLNEHINTIVNSVLDVMRRVEALENDMEVLRREVKYLQAAMDLKEKESWART